MDPCFINGYKTIHEVCGIFCPLVMRLSIHLCTLECLLSKNEYFGQWQLMLHFFLGRGQINRQPTSPTHHPCIYPIQVCSQPIRSLLLLASLVLGPASCPDWLAGEARRHKEKLYLPSPSILRKTALPHVQRWTVPAILMPRAGLWV